MADKTLQETIEDLTKQIKKLESKKERQGTSIGDVVDKINVETFFPSVFSPVGRAGQGVANVIQGVLNSARKRKLNKLKSKLESASGGIGSDSISPEESGGDLGLVASGGAGEMTMDLSPLQEMMQGIILSVENLNESIQNGMEGIKYCLEEIENLVDEILSVVMETQADRKSVEDRARARRIQSRHASRTDELEELEDDRRAERKRRFGGLGGMVSGLRGKLSTGAGAAAGGLTQMQNIISNLLPMVLPKAFALLIPLMLPLAGIIIAGLGLLTYFKNWKKWRDDLATAMYDPVEKLEELNKKSAEFIEVMKKGQEADRLFREGLTKEEEETMDTQVDNAFTAAQDVATTGNFAERALGRNTALLSTPELSRNSLVDQANEFSSTADMIEKNRGDMLEAIEEQGFFDRYFFEGPLMSPDSAGASLIDVMNQREAARQMQSSLLLFDLADRNKDGKIDTGTEQEEFNSYIDAGLHTIPMRKLQGLINQSGGMDSPASTVTPQLLNLGRPIAGVKKIITELEKTAIPIDKQRDLEEQARRRGAVGQGAGGSPPPNNISYNSTTIVESDPALGRERGRPVGYRQPTYDF